MELHLFEGETQYLGELRKIAAEKIRPFRSEIEAERQFSGDVLDVLKSLALPGDDGFEAEGRSASDFCFAAEAMAWGDLSAGYAWLNARQAAWMIASLGTAEQKAKWLPRFAGNPVLPASLYLQEGRGASPSEYETSVRAGNGLLRIDGYKSPVFHPVTAEVSVVVGRDADGALCVALLEGAQNGIRFTGLQSDRLALQACPSATEAWIDNLEVPAENLMTGGDVGRAVSVCRMAHAAFCIGVATAATSYAGDWARRRVAFGKPIISFQGVSFPLVDLLLATDAVRLGIQDLLRADISSDALELEVNQILAEANQVVQDAGREGVQTMGVHGVISDHPASSWYKAAAVLASLDFDPLASRLKFV